MKLPRFEIELELSVYQVDALRKVVRKIAKTAEKYAAAGESAASTVAAAKTRQLLAATGLMGALATKDEPRPTLFQRAEREYTKFLEEHVRGLAASIPTGSLPDIDPDHYLSIPIRSSCHREAVSEALDRATKEVIRVIYRSAFQNSSRKDATSVVESAFDLQRAKINELAGSLREELFARSGQASIIDDRVNELMKWWERDIAAGILQDIIEYRAGSVKYAQD